MLRSTEPMYTTPFATVGIGSISAPVSNDHTSTPVFALSACTVLPKSSPKYTIPSATATGPGRPDSKLESCLPVLALTANRSWPEGT